MLNLQNKFQMIKLFSHCLYTITGKYQEQSAILPMSVNLAVLRIAIVVRIPVSGNRKTPRFLRFLGQVGTRLYKSNVIGRFFFICKKSDKSKFAAKFPDVRSKFN